MEQKLLEELNTTENQIRIALEKNNFTQVSKLSSKFDDQINKLTYQLRVKDEISQQDINLLKELREKLTCLEKETVKQFRKFSSETSTKTKMHNAYKNYGG